MHRSGQSLIDVLIASAIGAILLVGALSVLAPALRGSADAEHVADGAAAARGLVDGVRALAAADWQDVAGLTAGTLYHLSFSSTSTTVVSGVDAAAATTTGITRWFTIANVRRDGAGSYVSSGGNVDSSTLALSVGYRVPGASTRTVSTFLTRSRGQAFLQTDWSGGSGQSSATGTVGNRFASSTGIEYADPTGSFQIDFPE